MHVEWTWLRRSATLWAGAVVAVVEVWLALTSRTAGLNLWADLVTGLSVGSLYTGVVASGFSAFEAGRWSRTTTELAQTSARTPALVRLLHIAVVAAPIVAGYLLALAVLAIYAVSTGAYGSPPISWLVALGCALLGSVAFGWLVGLLGRGRWWASPAAPVLFYAGYIVVHVLPLPNGIKALYPVVLAQDFVFVSPVLPTILGMAGFAVGAAVLAVLLIGRGWRASSRSPLLTLSVLSGVLVVAGVAAASVDGRYTSPIAAHDQEVCDRGSVEICINRGYAAALPPLRKRLDALNARAAGTPLVATHLEQGIAGGAPVRPGFRRFDIYQLQGRDDITSAVNDYVTDTITQDGRNPDCANGNDGVINARMFVTAWLSGYQNWFGHPTGFDRYEKLRAMPVAESNRWFRGHYKQFVACSIRLNELP